MGKNHLCSHTGCEEIGRCHTRSEFQGTCTMYTSAKCKYDCPLFGTQRRRQQKSNLGVSVIPKNGLVFPNLKKKDVHSDSYHHDNQFPLPTYFCNIGLNQICVRVCGWLCSNQLNWTSMKQGNSVPLFIVILAMRKYYRHSTQWHTTDTVLTQI